MATPTVPAAGAVSEPQSYGDFAGHLIYSLHELAYQAQAARALLHEHDQTEASETLTGVSYLLYRLRDDCKKLSDDVIGSEGTYQLKDEIARAER